MLASEPNHNILAVNLKELNSVVEREETSDHRLDIGDELDQVEGVGGAGCGEVEPVVSKSAGLDILVDLGEQLDLAS